MVGEDTDAKSKRHDAKRHAQDPSMTNLGHEVGPPLPGSSQVPMTDYKPQSQEDENWSITMLNLNPLMLEGRFEKKFNLFMLWLVKPVEFRRNA